MKAWLQIKTLPNFEIRCDVTYGTLHEASNHKKRVEYMDSQRVLWLLAWTIQSTGSDNKFNLELDRVYAYTFNQSDVKNI